MSGTVRSRPARDIDAAIEVTLPADYEFELVDGSYIRVRTPIVVEEVTIDENAALSGVIPLGGSTDGVAQLVGLQMPSAWTAASVSFDVSWDGTEWASLRFDNQEYVVDAAADQAVMLEVDALLAWPFVRLRSGTSGDPVNQDAARAIKCFIRNVR